MYPKRAKEVIVDYTEGTEMPLEDSDLMITHYYRTIRNKASSMDQHWNLRIVGLGNLKASYSKVINGLYTNREKKQKAEKEGDDYIYNSSRDKIKQLVSMIRFFRAEKKAEEESKKRKQLYKDQKNRKAYASKRDPRACMEEPGTNS